jgi:acyl dehydratase
VAVVLSKLPFPSRAFSRLGTRAALGGLSFEQVLDETETRIAELKKDAYEFKRDVVVGGENPRTGRTVAEKVQTRPHSGFARSL